MFPGSVDAVPLKKGRGGAEAVSGEAQQELECPELLLVLAMQYQSRS